MRFCARRAGRRAKRSAASCVPREASRAGPRERPESREGFSGRRPEGGPPGRRLRRRPEFFPLSRTFKYSWWSPEEGGLREAATGRLIATKCLPSVQTPSSQPSPSPSQQLGPDGEARACRGPAHTQPDAPQRCLPVGEKETLERRRRQCRTFTMRSSARQCQHRRELHHAWQQLHSRRGGGGWRSLKCVHPISQRSPIMS